MWRRVELENYRSIAEAKVDLAPFTVIVGPNGSGKSNFADALVFARDVAYDAQSAVSRRGGVLGLRRWSRTKPHDISVAVSVAESREGLEASSAGHLFVIKSKKAGEWEFALESIWWRPQKSKKANALLSVYDAGDDCPGTWGPDVERVAGIRIASAAVMAVREYESWLLHGEPDAALAKIPLRTRRVQMRCEDGPGADSPGLLPEHPPARLHARSRPRARPVPIAQLRQARAFSRGALRAAFDAASQSRHSAIRWPNQVVPTTRQKGTGSSRLRGHDTRSSQDQAGRVRARGFSAWRRGS